MLAAAPADAAAAAAAGPSQVEVEVVVSSSEAPELYGIQVDDALEAGPFEGTGLDLRSSGVLAAFRFPTVVLLVSGTAGIATARALIESPPDTADLALPLRGDVVVYYQVLGRGGGGRFFFGLGGQVGDLQRRLRWLVLMQRCVGMQCPTRREAPMHALFPPPKAPNEASFCYRDAFGAWPSIGPVRVVTTTRGFADAFDDDNLLMYDPDTTAAIILSECPTQPSPCQLPVEREAGLSA